MSNTIKIVTLFFIITFVCAACVNDDLVPVYEEQKAGKVVIRGYNALQDSVQISLNGKLLVMSKHDAFVKKVENNYEFVYYNDISRKIDIINKKTNEILKSYNFTKSKPIDTLSFYVKENIWIENVLSYKPGKLTGTGRTGFRFIFPAVNLYSKSGYSGALDAIIKKTNGQLLGIAENITNTSFSSFVEFPFSSPPIVSVEIVKHGTTESYVPEKKIIFQMALQNNKSKLIVLEEKATGNVFSGVEGTINLADYFTF